MADITEFTQADLEGLAAKLEAIDELSDGERAVLIGVFAAAGHVFAGDSEVSGFAAPPVSPFGSQPARLIRGCEGGLRSNFLAAFQPNPSVYFEGAGRTYAVGPPC